MGSQKAAEDTLASARGNAPPAGHLTASVPTSSMSPRCLQQLKTWPWGTDDRPTSTGWCTQHHVVSSRGNSALPRLRRAYFDHTPRSDPLFKDPGGRTLSGYMSLVLPSLPSAHSQSPVDVKSQEVSELRRLSRKLDVSVLLAAVQQPPPSQLEAVVTQHDPVTGGKARRRSPKSFRSSGGLGRRVTNRTRMAELSSAGALADFVSWCSKKHGGLVHVWRLLDKDSSLSLSKKEFTKGCAQLGWSGDLKKLWSILDRDHSDMVSFIHFAPEAALDLARVKHWAEVKFGSVQQLFRVIDRDRNKRLDVAEFVAGCKREGIPESLKSCLRTVFHWLDDKHQTEHLGLIVESELEFLHNWLCPAYLWEEPDDQGLTSFREAVLARYRQNPLVAWRMLFDRDGSMKVNYLEFVAGCRRLAKDGVAAAMPPQGVAALFCALDRNRGGWISLRLWDPPSYRLLSKFAVWARDTFGKVSGCVAAWEKQKGTGISLSGFCLGITPLGFCEDDMDLLFEGLSLEKLSWDGHKRTGGTIASNQISFLDSWQVEVQLEEELAWERLACGRVGTGPRH